MQRSFKTCFIDICCCLWNWRYNGQQFVDRYSQIIDKQVNLKVQTQGKNQLKGVYIFHADCWSTFTWYALSLGTVTRGRRYLVKFMHYLILKLFIKRMIRRVWFELFQKKCTNYKSVSVNLLKMYFNHINMLTRLEIIKKHILVCNRYKILGLFVK